MSTKRIEQLIEEIFEFVESCKASAFSSNKVIVPKEELYDLLDELRLKVPEEIKRCQKMIANRDAIIADAEDKAAAIEQAARAQAQVMINENEITQQAYYQANEMVRQATEHAEAIVAQAEETAMQYREGSIGYANNTLGHVEQLLASQYETIKVYTDNMLDTLRHSLEVVVSDRREMNGEAAPEELEPQQQMRQQMSQQMPQQEQGEEDFEFDENVFLDNIDTEE
ncbi:MAG: ATPase [Lachnospiraceae bacterium]|nr:ATPase [Lachnospiraceae bacterium]